MGGSGGMQRSSSSTVRTAMALCLGGLVVMTVLYLAKRVDSNKTHRELDMIKIESRDITEGLNNKLLECMDKIESLTQETTITGGELKNCKDTRASVIDQAQKLKIENEDCLKDLKTAGEEQDQAEAAMQQAKSDRGKALSEKKSADAELQQTQEENASIQSQFDECEAEKEHLQSLSDMEGRCNTKLAEIQSKLKTATERENALLEQIKVLTSQKKTLETKVATLLTDLSQNPNPVNDAQAEDEDQGEAILMKHPSAPDSSQYQERGQV